MILEYDTTFVTLDDPAQYPVEPVVELIQVKDMSAAGIIHVEDYEIRTDTTVYNFTDMSTSDYNAILNFFVNTVNGMSKEWYLTDDFSTRTLVRFVEPKVVFQQSFDGLWNGSFAVQTIT